MIVQKRTLQFKDVCIDDACYDNKYKTMNNVMIKAKNTNIGNNNNVKARLLASIVIILHLLKWYCLSFKFY